LYYHTNEQGLQLHHWHHHQNPSISKAVYVAFIPQAKIDTGQGCSGVSVQFNNSSSVPLDSLIGWQWYFDDPSSGANNTSVLQNPSHQFDTAGNYQVKLKVFTNYGCVDSVIQYISIKPSPTAGFTNSPACSGQYITFTDTSLVSFQTNYLKYWDFGDGANDAVANPVHLYDSTKGYNVTLSITDIHGCTDSVTKTVTVKELPTANFISGNLCLNTPFNFIDSSYIDNDTIVSWYWVFGSLGVSYDQNPVFSFSDTITYSVVLTATSSAGCSNSITKNLEVHKLPVANFSIDNQFGIPPNENVNFNNQSTGATSYLWNFGDNNTDNNSNAVHSYQDTGNYNVILYAYTNMGCTDSTTKQLTVRQPLLDVAVIDVIADCKTDFVQNISVYLINLGTREIKNMEIFARIQGGTAIMETWTGNLLPGDVMTYNFTASFQISNSESVNYFCVWVSNPNGQEDEVSSNNDSCIACMNDFALIDPFPNPTTSEMNLWFVLPNSEYVEIIIYDSKGAVVEIVFSDEANKGLNQIIVNTKRFNNGIYFFRFIYLNEVHVKSFVKH